MSLTVAGQRPNAAPATGSPDSVTASTSVGTAAASATASAEFASILAANAGVPTVAAAPAKPDPAAAAAAPTAPQTEDIPRNQTGLPGLAARALLALVLPPAAPATPATASASDNTAAAIRFLSQAIQQVDKSLETDDADAAVPAEGSATEDSLSDVTPSAAALPAAAVVSVPVVAAPVVAVPVIAVPVIAVPVVAVPVVAVPVVAAPRVTPAQVPGNSAGTSAAGPRDAAGAFVPAATAVSSTAPVPAAGHPTSPADTPLSAVTPPIGAGSPILAGAPAAAIRLGTETAAAGATGEDATSALPISTIAPAILPTSSTTAAVAAPAAPASSTPLATQVFRPLFTLVGASDGEHTLTISVTPDDLGPVTVRAHISGESMRIELFSSTDGGRDALRQIMTDLRRDLATAGMGADLSLSSKTQPDAGGTGQFGQGRDAHPAPTGGAPARGGGDGPRASVRISATAALSGKPTDSTFDVMA